MCEEFARFELITVEKGVGKGVVKSVGKSVGKILEMGKVICTNEGNK